MKKCITHRIIISITLLFCTFSAFADEWIGPYTIKEIKHIANKVGDSYQSHLLIVVNEEVNTKCQAANKNKQFQYHTLNDPNLWNSTWLTMALNAQSLGSKVKFYLEGTCHPSAARIHGISVIKE
ncbi:hypothetical protein [Zooshikella ganghwensis]|uniref:Uncharacterized protein n=1 Tax=Zooshikella ganghwensis TaxID=202772 RepID=A0A4P9VFQ7_9GAMM|nr:hypothetical protein [Zooshikella ganghwensis]RDH41776.1 hypothetical protein B9G39_26470 [Zooshikella ganghwensis]RDH41945.1 hypothetical protein B9G39_26390 [Zooshikella ganghwensis]